MCVCVCVYVSTITVTRWYLILIFVTVVHLDSVYVIFNVMTAGRVHGHGRKNVRFSAVDVRLLQGYV